MRSISEIRDFGAIAAEEDDVVRYFVATPMYEDLVERRRQIVIGRKGSGKSALYRAVLERAKSGNVPYLATGLTLGDYPWRVHYDFAQSELDRYVKFVASWQFISYLEIFKALLADNTRAQRYTPDEKEVLNGVEKWMVSTWGRSSFSYKDTFPEGKLGLRELEITPQIMGNSVGGVKIGRQTTLGQTLARMNEWLEGCLAVIAANAPPTYVLFDELDSGFDPKSDNYVDRVTGLLVAVRRMTLAFRRFEAPFAAVAFLRTDVYDRLHFGDKNKITEANVVRLEWNDDPHYHGASLKHLIDHRIRRQLELNDDESDPWSQAFDSQVMRGTQHKFHHMTFRTFMRPRDLIKFTNAALEAAQRRINRGDGQHLITNDDVSSGRNAYSDYLVRELDDEIAQVRPGWEVTLEFLRVVGATRFKKSALEVAHSRLAKETGLSMSVDELLEFYYEYSIVGFERVGRTGSSGYYDHFRFMDETVRFSPEANSYYVHRGLKDYLDLVDRSGAVSDPER